MRIMRCIQRGSPTASPESCVQLGVAEVYGGVAADRVKLVDAVVVHRLLAARQLFEQTDFHEEQTGHTSD